MKNKINTFLQDNEKKIRSMFEYALITFYALFCLSLGVGILWIAFIV